MGSVRRPKNHSKDDAVRSDSTGEAAERRAQTHARAAELVERDVSREAAHVLVVGPPGCCGCVSKSVPSSRRKH
jgi:hypothetical protein